MTLPDRNPSRPAVQEAAVPGSDSPTEVAAPAADAANAPPEAAATPSSATPAPTETAVTTAALPLPERKPIESLAAPAAPQGKLVDFPLPDPNPNRSASATPFALKGTLTPGSAALETAAPETAMPASIPKSPPGPDYASFLKPLLSYDLSTADEGYVRAVMRSSGGAEATAAKIKDPAARAFALWYKYRNGSYAGLAAAIEGFRVSHPDWPGQDELRERAETALFLDNVDPDKIRAFFAASTPLTGAGKASFASVRLKDGDEAAAKELVVSAWRDHQLNAAVEKKILDKFGNILTAEHHRARVDRLLYSDDSDTTAAALRVAKLLPADQQKKIAARVAVVKRGGNAGKLLDALPDSAIEADVGLRFNHIQWLRRTKDKERRLRAWKMLLDAPSEPNVLLDLNNWWTERRINCRGALNDGQPRVAYEIASKHGLVSGDGYIEAEHLAGWIALRFLNEPHTALRHYLALRKVATSSKSIALGEYWLGRTALALGDRDSAIVHFHGAAKYPQYFYGQLGRQALDPKPARLEVTGTPVPTEADVARFMSREAVRAIGVARALKMEGATPQFFLALSRKLNHPAEVVLLAELAKTLDQKQIALRLAKIAFNRDLPLGDYALPIGVMPEFKSLLTERIDSALVHALSRQESEFNAAAKSPVGASGLMQLMPATARAVARQYKVQYSAAQLTNPTYNTQLGEAFLGDLVDSYNGSYFLALAAYNAGGGRVAEWMKAFGDPRDPNVDPIDWIERIPFTETRHYVFKIMETLQLYRSRLAGPKDALHLVQDLNRGRRVPQSETASVVQAKTE